MKVVKTRRLLDAPNVGIMDIDGTPVKQLNAMYAKHHSQLMQNFVPIGKIMQNQEQNGSIHPITNRTNQQPELLVAVKNLTLRMTSWPLQNRHLSKRENF